MVKKLFSLSEADLELLKDVKGQNTFLENDSDTLRYILKHYQELEEENEELRRVTSGSANIESVVLEMLDGLNTLLIANELETCCLADRYESPVLTKSREYHKQKLAKMKQRKDHKQKKYGRYDK